MNHYNFFEDVRKEKSTLNVPAACAVMFAAAAVILAGMYLAANGKLTEAERELNYLKTVEEDPAFRQQYQQEKQLEKDLDRAEEDYAFLTAAGWLTVNGDTADETLVRDVLACFPQGTKAVKMTVSQYDVTVEGVAKDLTAMIGVEKKLDGCGRFTEVFVTTAKEDTHADVNGKDSVTFQCRMKLAKKEAAADEKE